MTDFSQTALLLNQIRQGDEQATNQLFRQCYPMLLSWAHGRIPISEHSTLDTTDLVQETLIKGLNKLDTFKPLRPGSFLAYLRAIFINEINHSLRRSKPSINMDGLSNHKTEFRVESDSESFMIYEEALHKLSADEQELLILRLEFGLTFTELAKATEKASEDAARMAFSRALQKLSQVMVR